MLGPIISENEPPFFAPWVTLAHQSWKKSEALRKGLRATLDSYMFVHISELKTQENTEEITKLNKRTPTGME